MKRLSLMLAIILLITCSGCFWYTGHEGYGEHDHGGYGEHDRGGYGGHDHGGHDDRDHGEHEERH